MGSTSLIYEEKFTLLGKLKRMIPWIEDPDPILKEKLVNKKGMNEQDRQRLLEMHKEVERYKEEQREKEKRRQERRS